MAGLSSFLALAVGVILWVALRDEPYVAPPPAAPSQRVQPVPAAALLQDLTRAVRSRDEAAAAELAAAGETEAAAQLRTLVANAAEIGLRDVSLRYLTELGGIDPDGEWPATATLTWRFGPVDTGVATTEVRIDFTDAAGSVGISGLGTASGGPSAAAPIWFADPVEVRRTPGTMVVATSRVEAYASLARRAVVVVRRVLPDWRGDLVVEVPASAADLEVALGAEPGTYGNVAGVTSTIDGSGAVDVPVHVFLNPVRISELRPAGAQVVVSHEAAHVALQATSSTLPVWLSEGFADYVALRDVPLPLSTTAAQIIRQVRREGPPRMLPDDADFDEQSEYFGAAYEASWLACRLLVERVGEDALLEFYRRADGAEGFARLFRRSFGLTEQQFTAQWRAALSDLARRGSGE